jgi:uncharacterized membrane protein
LEDETESEVIDAILEVIEHVAVGIEVLAVAVIVVGIVGATYAYLVRSGERRAADGDVRYRERLGRTLLLGLEILVAADIVRTVALDPSLESVAVLGLLVVIRTFLSWALVVEIEHRWPWQRSDESRAGSGGTGEE